MFSLLFNLVINNKTSLVNLKKLGNHIALHHEKEKNSWIVSAYEPLQITLSLGCLLYTSDAADDLLCVDIGGRRIIKKKKHYKKKTNKHIKHN